MQLPLGTEETGRLSEPRRRMAPIVPTFIQTLLWCGKRSSNSMALMIMPMIAELPFSRVMSRQYRARSIQL